MTTIANYIAPVGNYLAKQFPTPLTKVAAAVVIGSALNALKNFTCYETGFGQKSGVGDREIQILDAEIAYLNNRVDRLAAKMRKPDFDPDDRENREKLIEEAEASTLLLKKHMGRRTTLLRKKDKNEDAAFLRNVNPLLLIIAPCFYAFANGRTSRAGLCIGVAVSLIPPIVNYASKYSATAKKVATVMNSFGFAMITSFACTSILLIVAFRQGIEDAAKISAQTKILLNSLKAQKSNQ